MLNKMCVKLAWTNMYVTIVHGCRYTYAGTSANEFATPATVCSRKKTTMFAMIRRRTQGVTGGTP